MASVRGDAQLSTWLTRIAINEALGRARKQRRRAEIIRLDAGPEMQDDHAEPDVPPVSSEPPESAALRAEVRRLIESKIDHLPDAFRRAFVPRALADVSVDETTTGPDLPLGHAVSRDFRATALLLEPQARDILFIS